MEEEKKNEVIQKEIKNNFDDVWDDGAEFVDRSLTYNEKTGDYFFCRETVKKEEKVVPKPVSKYTPKEANSKNKNKPKLNPNMKLNEYDEEDYDYDNDYDEDNEQYYKSDKN